MNNTAQPINIYRIGDFRVEVFASLLADNDIPFAVKRKGYSLDIQTIQEECYDYDQPRIWIITL